MYKTYIKRLIDFIVALIILLLASPIIMIFAILLYIVNDRKPFFFQNRPGKDAKIFKIVKFKTMNDRKDSNGNLLSDSERITAVGAFVRKTSIDELPQLLNVILGDMSLIGPRPLLPQYLSLYSDFQKRRHEVRPGITGWAQINGRNGISWNKKFEYDVWYVDNVGILLDLKILFFTVKKVLVSEGISSSSSATMEAFKGNN